MYQKNIQKSPNICFWKLVARTDEIRQELSDYGYDFEPYLPRNHKCFRCSGFGRECVNYEMCEKE